MVQHAARCIPQAIGQHSRFFLGSSVFWAACKQVPGMQYAAEVGNLLFGSRLAALCGANVDAPKG